MRLALPLAAAFFAALAAHVAIDIAGDYLLPHDTYDDAAHGSRGLASMALAASVLGALWAFARATLREVRGIRGALRAALRAAVPSSTAAFAVSVAAAALPLLVGMAWLDARCDGTRVDDVADLLGGSLPLGAGIALAFAVAAAAFVQRFVALVSRFHCAIVRVVEAFVRPMSPAMCGPLLITCKAPDRPRVLAALARCVGADRAPPRLPCSPF